ncbi:MAG TPA: zf-HC2 domain-containing protein [Candidatus Angelobacter sp.]|nr:zf-HC2 domain-containing protein [Candidatus Angelobacter sp.]
MNHQEIIELLPWYANQTLADEERKLVEMHLADCRDCAKEVESLKAMRKTVVEVGDSGPVLSPFALNRALAEIEDYERTRTTTARAAIVAEQEKKGFWARWWQPTPVFARALIAAQIVLVLALGSVTLYQYAHPNIIFKTSSGGVDDKTSTRITVGFNEDATEQEIRQTISGIEGQIVEGPSALGLYTIQVPIPRERAAEIDKVLQTLRQNSRVVRFAAEKQ